jgi:HK97 family phage major capsid protein
MDYRKKITEFRDEGNKLFEKADTEKRVLTEDEHKKIDALNASIDREEREMNDFIKLNHIPEDQLRNYEPNKPNPGRAADEQKAEKRAAFFRYIREGRNGLNKEERALVEDTSGLYMMPEDLEAEIYRALPQLNVIRQLATVRPTVRDKVRRRSLTEVSVGWGKLETGTVVTESTMTPSQDYIYVEDMNGLTKIGKDELQDSDAALSAIIADSFARAIANAEAKAFTVGTGHTYNQPDGVTLDATIISTYTDLATADTAVPDDLLGIEYELPAQYLADASFVLHRKAEAMVRKAKNTYGPYLWQPSLMVGAPRTFDTYPIYNQNDMVYPASTNTNRSIVAVFGNWKAGYEIVDRLGVTVQRLDELYAEAGLIGFLVHFRVGGGVVRPDAFRALDNST